MDERRSARQTAAVISGVFPTMLTLYFSNGACSLASHIALEEAGADYEAKRVDFKSNAQQSPDYLKINPKGRVPVLMTPQGILTESPAILAYVAQSFPKAELAPLDDPFAFAQMQSFNSYLCSTVHVAHAHRPRGSRWADEEGSLADMKRKVPQAMTACFNMIEQNMLKGPWVMGERYTVADPYLFTLGRWLKSDSVDIAAFPRVYDHHRRMAERPNVKKTLEAEGLV
jgi:glutathione S-transferase